MKLPDHEQRELEEIERRLAEDDPKFAARLNRPAPRIPHRTLVLAGVLAFYVAGLVVVMTGVSLALPVITALGAAMLLAVFAWFAVRAWRADQK
ncbi:DUF3040 domain-containing protein [Lentzea sp. NBRC 102530]|uniref:DUF3040 domain-containing protein n=1 Tax=Lentzea sp. NBRC 102530 TaxID=3032201 RepID=UPI00249FCCA7|nr:DUF3040 domain-containing protein [Lentzea sp. NBRC 102530]GLY50570.1 hypothetical protein Lesp01_42260 [Lentzea sp. NBRC 102530]